MVLSSRLQFHHRYRIREQDSSIRFGFWLSNEIWIHFYLQIRYEPSWSNLGVFSYSIKF